MRQKMTNSFFTFLYPGRAPGGGTPPDDAPQVAIPHKEMWVAISGDSPHKAERSSAIFYSTKNLRALAEVLCEAADMLEGKGADDGNN